MDLRRLAGQVRGYRGVRRKAPIEAVAGALIPADSPDVIAAHGEDAAAIRSGRQVLLLAADGIVESMVSKDPEWAGYCSVLVNVNDIAAMGGIPVAMVNVLSCRDARVRACLVRGMRRACDKFGVPMVGGHLHPDSSYSSVDVAVLGRTTPSRLVLSSGAREGDAVVYAMDLDGEFTPGFPFSWDTTSGKSAGDVRRRVLSMNLVAPRLTAGKDISNPGALGTLGMLLEASGKGAEVDPSLVPIPEGVDLRQWMTAYQGCGFVVTCGRQDARGVARSFGRAGLTASVCGTVIRSHELRLVHDEQREVLFDLARDTFGCAKPDRRP